MVQEPLLTCTHNKKVPLWGSKHKHTGKLDILVIILLFQIRIKGSMNVSHWKYVQEFLISWDLYSNFYQLVLMPMECACLDDADWIPFSLDEKYYWRSSCCTVVYRKIHAESYNILVRLFQFKHCSTQAFHWRQFILII